MPPNANAFSPAVLEAARIRPTVRRLTRPGKDDVAVETMVSEMDASAAA